MTDSRQPHSGRETSAAASHVPIAGTKSREHEPNRPTSDVETHRRVVEVLELISDDLLEQVECCLSGDTVDRLIELYEIVGLQELAQAFTDELDFVYPEVDWEVS